MVLPGDPIGSVKRRVGVWFLNRTMRNGIDLRKLRFLPDSFTLPVGAPNEEGAKAWLKTVGSADGQEAFNTKKGSIPVRTDADPMAYNEYQQAAMKAFADDTIVPSLTHGAAAPVAWSNEIMSAVGQFGSTNDVGQFQDALVAAADTHLQ